MSQKKDVEEISEDSSVSVSSGETEEEWEVGTDDHTGDESDYDDEDDNNDELLCECQPFIARTCDNVFSS